MICKKALIDDFIVASDVLYRDGIGIEIYVKGKCVIEIFRDDTKRTRVITVLDENVSLELMEETIKLFKEKIAWDFVD